MTGIIYKWTNIVNNKVYIGQTVNQKRRYREFICIDRYYTSNDSSNLTKIDKARIKYGINNFNYQILEEIQTEDREELLNRLNELEEYYINKYNSIENGYNTLKGGSSYIHKNRGENINKGGRPKVDYVVTNEIVYLPRDFKIKPGLALIYLYIQLYSINNISTVSYQEICNLSGKSINFVRECVKRLESLKYLEVDYSKSPITYKFTLSNTDNCEQFSVKFLTNTDLSFTEKAYIAASYQYMFKDIQPYGKLALSNKDLAEKLNVSEKSIYRLNKDLTRKEILQIFKESKKNLETGCSEELKVFNLQKCGQAALWLIQDNSERLDVIEEKDRERDELIKSQQKMIEMMQEEINKLKTANKFIM